MFLVFDVGGTFTKYAWMTDEGEIVEKSKYPTITHGDKATVENFVSEIESIYRIYKEKGPVTGIAMSLPGQIDVENGIVYGGGALKYLDEVNVGELISKQCDGVRIALENDGKCAALAEVWKGNASTVNDACVLIIGTGVGGGIIIDRKVHRGSRMLAGEISYMLDNMYIEDMKKIIPVEKTKQVTEIFDEMPFLVAGTGTAAGLCFQASKELNMPFEEVSGELIYKLADEGNEKANALLEKLYFTIAKMCVNLYVTIDPEVILIGGGISAEPKFVEGIKRYIEGMKGITKMFNGMKIDTCKFRNDSNLLGAIFNFKQLYKCI